MRTDAQLRSQLNATITERYRMHLITAQQSREVYVAKRDLKYSRGSDAQAGTQKANRVLDRLPRQITSALRRATEGVKSTQRGLRFDNAAAKPIKGLLAFLSDRAPEAVPQWTKALERVEQRLSAKDPRMIRIASRQKSIHGELTKRMDDAFAKEFGDVRADIAKLNPGTLDRAVARKLAGRAMELIQTLDATASAREVRMLPTGEGSSYISGTQRGVLGLSGGEIHGSSRWKTQMPILDAAEYGLRVKSYASGTKGGLNALDARRYMEKAILATEIVAGLQRAGAPEAVGLSRWASQSRIQLQVEGAPTYETNQYHPERSGWMNPVGKPIDINLGQGSAGILTAMKKNGMATSAMLRTLEPLSNQLYQ